MMMTIAVIIVVLNMLMITTIVVKMIPIKVTLVGIVTDVSDEHELKAKEPNDSVMVIINMLSNDK